MQVIDQRWLPHEFRVVPLRTRADFADAIRDMWVRGAPLIGRQRPGAWRWKWRAIRQTRRWRAFMPS